MKASELVGQYLNQVSDNKPEELIRRVLVSHYASSDADTDS